MMRRVQKDPAYEKLCNDEKTVGRVLLDPPQG